MKKKLKSVKNVACFLGKDAEFEGTLKFSGTALIEGSFKGKILARGTTLLIDKTAHIESDIEALSVVNYGEVHGNIRAEKEISLRSPGKVFGNIEAPSVEIESGVVFEGTSWQRKPQLSEDET